MGPTISCTTFPTMYLDVGNISQNTISPTYQNNVMTNHDIQQTHKTPKNTSTFGEEEKYTSNCGTQSIFDSFSLFISKTEGRQANTKAQEATYHLASFYQVERRLHSRETEPPTFSLRFKFPSTVIQ